MSERFLPATGDVRLPTDRPPLSYAGLDVVSLTEGAGHRLATGGDEVAVLSLSGSASVRVDDTSFPLKGRPDVFSGPSDFVFAPAGSAVEIHSERGGRFAVCRAVASGHVDAYRVGADAVPIEVRGGGPATRQIDNFLAAGVHDASRLIAVEVITPSGGWSSYPPHKHDEFTDEEVALEEIYYFEIAGGGFGLFTAATTDGAIRDTVTVHTGDVYLVPDGYHGPAAAAPGYHMYYLNVMAGPGDERVWRFCDDPAHASLRPWLDTLPPDPRLPMTAH